MVKVLARRAHAILRPAARRRTLSPALALSLPSLYSSSAAGPSPAYPAKALGPRDAYNLLVASGARRDDAHQRRTVLLLQQLHDDVLRYDRDVRRSTREISRQLPEQLPLFSRTLASLFSPASSSNSDAPATTTTTLAQPKGIYMHGDVGSGKTMSMDLFFRTLPIPRKRRVHFHEWMQDIHRRIHKLRQQRALNIVPTIAREIVENHYVICFDEFQVTDIADAMILRSLVAEMLANGAVFVITSNRHPDGLYKNGIQRQSFLPCIQDIKASCIVHRLDSGIDYRKEKQGNTKIYLSPLNDATKAKIEKIWTALLKQRGGTVASKKFPLLGRHLVVPQCFDKVARFTFDQLCGESYSAADFLVLAEKFEIVFLLDVPKMSIKHKNEARRFITLLDALYNSQRKLFMTLEADIVDLFSGDAAHDKHTLSAEQMRIMEELSIDFSKLNSPLLTGEEEIFAFQRAISRLVEMQSTEWLGSDLITIVKEAEA